MIENQKSAVKVDVPPIVARATHELSELLSRSDGTLASLILRKKGLGVGPLGAQTVYNDDLVHVLLWTGFRYPELAEHSLKQLDDIWGRGTLSSDLVESAYEAGCTDVTITDTSHAIQEIWEALGRASHVASTDSYINGYEEVARRDDLSALIPTVETTSEMPSRNMEPYQVNGKTVVGVKMYVGSGNPADPGRSPKPGTLYISGVKLGEVILNEARNGHWHVDHKPKTVVKQILRDMLPIGRYVRYCLDPDSLISFKVGKEASISAKRGGVVIDPEAVRSLFKIAG